VSEPRAVVNLPDRAGRQIVFPMVLLSAPLDNPSRARLSNSACWRRRNSWINTRVVRACLHQHSDSLGGPPLPCTPRVSNINPRVTVTRFRFRTIPWDGPHTPQSHIITTISGCQTTLVPHITTNSDPPPSLGRTRRVRHYALRSAYDGHPPGYPRLRAPPLERAGKCARCSLSERRAPIPTTLPCFPDRPPRGNSGNVFNVGAFTGARNLAQLSTYFRLPVSPSSAAGRTAFDRRPDPGGTALDAAIRAAAARPPRPLRAPLSG